MDVAIHIHALHFHQAVIAMLSLIYCNSVLQFLLSLIHLHIEPHVSEYYQKVQHAQKPLNFRHST